MDSMECKNSTRVDSSVPVPKSWSNEPGILVDPYTNTTVRTRTGHTSSRVVLCVHAASGAHIQRHGRTRERDDSSATETPPNADAQRRRPTAGGESGHVPVRHARTHARRKRRRNEGSSGFSTEWRTPSHSGEPVKSAQCTVGKQAGKGWHDVPAPVFVENQVKVRKVQPGTGKLAAAAAPVTECS
ncbi:metal transport system ABC transporter substrate-binding protein [Anopheles sinensis]|uniref:Metal transport system ABC transporter substrate-binding protein n=1 Tax=Anopheles sinensis TaxID=74873 RepID=A0A084WS14_ANOSI|nr:metal transport system ABC transporter substrate-binding protein [Anopheles sinensis]